MRDCRCNLLIPTIFQQERAQWRQVENIQVWTETNNNDRAGRFAFRFQIIFHYLSLSLSLSLRCKPLKAV